MHKLSPGGSFAPPSSHRARPVRRHAGRGPLLAACGSEAHPGAAAVVGGDRIDVATVQAQAADVRTAQQKSEQSEELVTKSGRS